MHIIALSVFVVHLLCRKQRNLHDKLNMSAQTALRSLLAELVDDAAKDRADEAPEAWAALEKFARYCNCPLFKHLDLGSPIIQNPKV